MRESRNLVLKKNFSNFYYKKIMLKRFIKKMMEFFRQVSEGIDKTQYKNGHGKV